MQLTAMQPLTRRVLDHLRADTLDLGASAITVPSADFTDPERHWRDQQLMRDVPHVVAWSGEIPAPGSYTTKEVAGTPVLLVRDRDGEVHAFVNACAHRASQVASGCGSAARFTCPYHAWTYDLEGCLVGLPQRETFDGFDLAGVGLLPLPVEEQSGLLVVGLSPDVDVRGTLDPLRPELDAFGFGRYAHAETRTFDLRANWKLVVDVNFEGYHFPYLHRDTLAHFCTNHSVFDAFGDHCRWAFPFNETAGLADVPESEWPERFTGTVVYGLFPSCVLVESPYSTQMLRIYPGATPGESTVFLTGGAFEPIGDDEHLARITQGLEGACEVLRDEDFPAAESCQRGIEHGPERVIVGRAEALLQHFHRVWDQHAGVASGALHG